MGPVILLVGLHGKPMTLPEEHFARLYAYTFFRCGKPPMISQWKCSFIQLFVLPPNEHYFFSPRNLVPVGSTLFFLGSNWSNGVELYKTDGTSAGTVLVKILAVMTIPLPIFFTVTMISQSLKRG